MASRPKTKVLFLIHTLGGGGAEKVLVDTVNSLDKTMFDITVMTVINTGVNIAKLGKDITYKTMITPPSFLRSKSASGSLAANASGKVKVFGALYNLLWRLMPASLVYRAFVRGTYNVEVAFLEGISAKIIAKSSNKQSRKISWIHVDFSNEHKAGKVFVSKASERRCYDSFDGLVCVSEATERGFHKVVGLPEKTQVLRNVVDVSSVVMAGRDVQVKKPHLFTICTVGRLAYQKGYDRLLRVAHRLHNDGLLFQLNIVGDGPEKQELEGYITEHSLKNVALLGFQKNPYAYMKSADLFVISSRAEGFSTVMTEATLLGTPLITTKVSGSEVLPAEMVTENSEDGIYVGLKRLLEDKKAYKQLQQVTLDEQKQFTEGTKQAIKDVEELLSC